MRGLWSVVGTAGRVLCRPSSSSSGHGNGRPPVPLGARILTNPDRIFQHNMWDHVQWSEEETESARLKAAEHSSERIPLEDQAKFDTDACKYWDGFYETHQNKFFKDRRWLFLEFPELLGWGPGPCGPGVSRPGDVATSSVGGRSQNLGAPAQITRHTDTFPGHQATFRILEIGCGAGNSVFPIITSIKGTGSFLYCCDFSPRAMELVKSHPEYQPSLCHAFIHDVCDEAAIFPFPPLSLDVILLVFVLSSIHPERMQGVLNRLTPYLRPGGVFLFRDYGRYDLSQLRFKTGRCLSENFYSRGDGTCVYFFTKEEVQHLFTSAGLEEVQNLEDRRLQVNRRKKVVMRRVWMQSKYRKPA